MRVVELIATVDRATIIPDHYITDAPGVLVDKPGLGAKRPDLVQQGVAVRQRQIHERCIEAATKVDRLAVAFRMSTNRRMDRTFDLGDIGYLSRSFAQFADARIRGIVTYKVRAQARPQRTRPLGPP